MHVTRKTAGTAEKLVRQQLLLCDIQINILPTMHKQVHSNLQPVKMWMNLTVTSQCHPRSKLMVQWDSSYMISLVLNIGHNLPCLRDIRLQRVTLTLPFQGQWWSNMMVPLLDAPHMISFLLSSFTRCKLLKSVCPWLWPSKVTQDEMRWCCWTPLPINV